MSLSKRPLAARPHFALGVLTLINFLNYLDRYLVAAILPQIEKAYSIDHKHAGLLATIFILVYLGVAPLSGYLGDRMPRKVLVAISVLIWSLATIASGLAPTYGWLLVARCFIGFGESGYGTVTPSMISDLYPREKRTQMLAVFYVAMPAGAAAGYAVGGIVSKIWSWHAAFFVGGVPGILLALLALVMVEPRRGATDTEAPEKIPFWVGMKALAGNGVFWTTTVGLALMTFAIGGLGYFVPSFLEIERHLPGARANTMFGAVTALAGLLGTLAGGWLGARAERRSHVGGLMIAGIGLVAAAPLMVGTVLTPSELGIYLVVFVAQFLIWLNTGPLNAAIVNCVPTNFRAFAMGLNLMLIHLFGDAPSPPIIGAIADRFSLGTAIQLNAIPLLIGGLVLVIGSWLMRDGAARPANAS
jgi:MFS family permease